MSADDRPLAFSSLGAPGATVAELKEIADAGGIRSVELRCADGELLAPDTSLEEARRLGTALAEAGLHPICVASYVRIARDDGDPVGEAVAHVRLAEAVGSPFVRVFGGVEGVAESEEVAARRLADVAAAIEGSDVTVLIETHDVFLTGAALSRILTRAGSDRLGALWDAVNPWRAGESPEATAAALAPWLRHVQLKDAAGPTELAPVLPGGGAVPLRGILEALDGIGYTAAISLEWERAWYPEVAPLPIAIDAFRGVLAAHSS
ncbi:sugar phosphate isomerase/epimerase family protein [Promicromonospora sp. NPDC023987]|uniref:sugar phosphate isomerase/epimerase family protein n=1 Tax=Promicromonospora sp. NPDC023987 TaxID=3155360 RepID=UPI0033EC9C61